MVTTKSEIKSEIEGGTQISLGIFLYCLNMLLKEYIKF